MLLDVIFISYDEPNADENWDKLKELVPDAKRVHGIKGIAEAHKAAAKKSETTHFFCIDADNIVDDTFNFEKVIDFQRQDKRIHAWGCRNSVNGLAYGYGGVKLFPTSCVERAEKYSVDFCTSVAENYGGFRFHKEIASTTYFNTTPYNAWKSGFRECAKLASGIIDNQVDQETINRLSVWMSVGLDSKYGDYTIAGARMGAVLGIHHAREGEKFDIDIDMELHDINNFEKCKSLFDSTVKISDVFDVINEYGEIVGTYNISPPPLYTPELSRHFKQVVYNL